MHRNDLHALHVRALRLVGDAEKFANTNHRGQVRKYTGEPYVTHCRAVAKLVEAADCGNEAIAAAWLHDTVEDCEGITMKTIADRFGPTVADYVHYLTDPECPPDWNRQARKSYQAGRLAGAPAVVQSIKLADLIHNTSSIVVYDPNFARIYLNEKFFLWQKCLTRGNALLRAMAEMQLREGMKYLHDRKQGS